MSEKMKNIPKLRFPEFINDKEWKNIPLSQIGEIITGNTPSTTDLKNYGGDKLFVSPADISDKRYITTTKTTLSEKGFALTRFIKANSILFVCIGSTIGKVAQNKIDCATNQQINSIVPFSKYDNDFIYSSLENNSSKIALMAGNHAVPIINKTLFSTVLIACPLLVEQKKIADCLSSLDSIISAQSQKIELLKEHKKGLLQNLFPRDGENIPKFRFPEFVNDGEWENKKVGDIFQITRGYVLSMNFVVEIQTNKKNYPVYSSQTKNNGLAGYYSEYIYENAITWTTDGANAGDVNYREGKFYCTNVCGVLLNEEGYANLCIAEIINSVSKNYVSYVGNPKLMNGVMSKIEIRIPSLKEQQKIAIFLTSMDREINLEIQKVEALKEHKKALLQQLFPSNEVING